MGELLSLQPYTALPMCHLLSCESLRATDLTFPSTASLKLLQEGPKGRALLEQCLEGLKKELQGLRSQVQELVQNQMKARPGKLGPASGFHQELQSE
jgi:hypothetical protein